MQTTMKLSASLIFISWVAVSALAETGSVQLSGATIRLPEPSGYYRYDGKSPKVDRFQQSAIPPSNRLLATFGPEDDLAKVLSNSFPRLTRSFNAQSIRKLEDFTVSPDHFAELKAVTRKQIETIRQKLAPKFPDIESKASTSLSNELQTRTDFKLGDMIPLGIFDETADSISYSMLAKSSIAVGEGDSPTETVSVVAVCAMNVRDRVVYLYCFSTYRDRPDIDWVRSAVKQWRDAIRISNAAQK